MPHNMNQLTIAAKSAAVMVSPEDERYYRLHAAQADMTISDFGRLALDRLIAAMATAPMRSVPVETGSKDDPGRLARRYALLVAERKAAGLPLVSVREAAAAAAMGRPYMVNVRSAKK